MTNPRPSERELGQYYQSDAYISHSNKSTTLVDLAYKISRNFTLKWKYNLLQKYSQRKPQSILDYGCGTGTFLSECHQRGMEIAGVEPSDTARTRANEINQGKIVSDLQAIKTSFDIITLWHVLEHVSDLHDTLEKLKAHLKDNGTMFIAVPNLQSLDAKTYNENWAAYDVPRHLWHFSKKTMEILLNRHNLKLFHTAPMKLDAFYVSLLSEKYKNGNHTVSGMARALLKGWRSNTAAKNNREYSSLIYIASK